MLLYRALWYPERSMISRTAPPPGNLPTASRNERDDNRPFALPAFAPQLLTPVEVAALLRVSRSTVYRLVESRLVPFYRVAGALRFERRDILDYLTGQRTATGRPT